jgi:glutathione S-transferase
MGNYRWRSGSALGIYFGMKIYGFAYSPYVRKVEMLLELAGLQYEHVEVSYGDRSELVGLTGGSVEVPVAVDDDGTVTADSRAICERILRGGAAERLLPAPLEGPIWAYADFCDGPLEDVLFRIATPDLTEQKATPAERALFVYIKERKFGKGCVEAWRAQREELLARGRRLLAPTLQTLARVPFVFGQRPTLADAALYGTLAMLQGASSGQVAALSGQLAEYMERLESEVSVRSGG